jgi:hypothetical protein
VTGDRRIEERDDIVAAVSDDTHCGLRVVDVPLTLGQDH